MGISTLKEKMDWVDKKWLVNGDYYIEDNRAFEKFLKTRERQNASGNYTYEKISVIRVDIEGKNIKYKSLIKLPIRAISTQEDKLISPKKDQGVDYLNDSYITRCLLDLTEYNKYLHEIEKLYEGD